MKMKSSVFLDKPESSSCVDLSCIESIPERILSRLKEYKKLFKREEFIDNLSEVPEILEIVEELNDLADKKGIVGYHFTRNFKTSIERNGLIVKTCEERREDFVKEYNTLFTPQQMNRIIDIWNSDFVEGQNKVRDTRIWFNLTRNGLNNRGAELLLSHFGGEVIYFHLMGDAEIKAILMSIGEPMIVKCSLETKSLKTFPLFPWGKVWLSTYQRSINHRANFNDPDVYTGSSIKPENIIGIEVLSDNEF